MTHLELYYKCVSKPGEVQATGELWLLWWRGTGGTVSSSGCSEKCIILFQVYSPSVPRGPNGKNTGFSGAT